ncbi:MAG TPA: ROK family protein [Chloroflexota bacterium]|nr:ROK family protein [Chloroflexota bacterium]
MPRLGAVEGGGTKFVCAVGTGPERVLARARIETTTPQETLDRVCDFLLRQAAEAPLDAVGVACFGPLELDPRSPELGSLLATPKPGWSGAPVGRTLRERLGVPVVVDTDVNGAALAEARWGAARDCDPALYLTIGTGIGGGAVIDGRPLHGLLHPEMGHILLPRLPWPDGRPDDFPGACPFHGACFEGLAAGPALTARAGTSLESLDPEHPLWELAAGYIATALATYILVLAPQRIVVGGGVPQGGHLLRRVRRRLPAVLAGYVKRPQVDSGVGEYVVTPRFGQDAGVMGALALAQSAVAEA